MSGGSPPPLRILCLHGYRQDARSFHVRTGALRKALRGQAELVSISAPHALRVPGDGPGGAPCFGDPGGPASRGGDVAEGLGVSGLSRARPARAVLGAGPGAALAAVGFLAHLPPLVRPRHGLRDSVLWCGGWDTGASLPPRPGPADAGRRLPSPACPQNLPAVSESLLPQLLPPCCGGKLSMETHTGPGH
uniref:Esterase OVCA2 n=1 Tax=Crocodylus porosus TaxID=8502 RepID=A0A7M4FEG1_CROPO